MLMCALDVTSASAAKFVPPSAACRPYRQATWTIARPLVEPLGPLATALDFGCGDGWFGEALLAAQLAHKVIGVEVRPRGHSAIDLVLYDGRRLPLADRACDLACAIDSLHHAQDPPAMLSELLRVTGKHLLLKDHTYKRAAGRWALRALDAVGNWPQGASARAVYQHHWQWDDVLERAGFRLVERIHPAPCHQGLLGRLTNSLQFVALWHRAE